jgi:predicted CXXCH cytochrome family protein
VACHEDYEPAADPAPDHPVGGEVTCTGCHSPHWGEGPGMMRGPERLVCLECHSDVRTEIEAGASTHPLEVGGGRCTSCHQPHDAVAGPLLARERAELCAGCHESHSRFAHPMGPNVPDPRTPGQTIDCLSCHYPHASDQKMMLRASPERELCVSCHGDLH